MAVRPIEDRDRPWLRETVERAWGLPVISPSGEHDPSYLPGFIAEAGDKRLGAATYLIDGDDCELVTIQTLAPGRGMGRALLSAVRGVAAARGCKRLWLVTTNDNLDALGFYQRLGFDLCALHRNWIDVVRRAKPGIGSPSTDGIPFRHALELELRLDDSG